MEKLIKVGTRNSQLALIQAQIVCDALREANPEIKTELVYFTTLGDKKRDIPDAPRDKKDWIYEIEQALKSGEVDLAVHSAKDVPANIESGTMVRPVLCRDEANDIFVPNPTMFSERGKKLIDMPKGAKIGTSSLRRRAQILRIRPDLEVVSFRGNISTRIKKLSESNELAGIVIAQAGIKRLGLDFIDFELLDSSVFMPAVSQGVLVVQYQANREDCREIVRTIEDRETVACWLAERVVIEKLQADCRSAVGVYANIESGNLVVRARLFSNDGLQCLEASAEGEVSSAYQVGSELASKLIDCDALSIMHKA